jgi:DNA-binding FadR family transcriptional regulator
VEIAQLIVDDITDDRLEAGTRLQSERDMVARFGVGRGTLRESLRFLEMTGVLTMKAGPQGGPFVADPDAHDLAGSLGLFLQLRTVPFSQIITAREILEPELAGHAATGATDEICEILEDSIAGMEAFLDDDENFQAENDRFHAAVATAAGNHLFTLLIVSLHQITDGMPLGVTYSMQNRANILEAHKTIAKAIRTGDPEGARWAMRRHMREFHQFVKRKYPDAYDRPVKWRDVAQ